jgi:hypothetical protein
MHGVAPHMCGQVGRPLSGRGAGGRSPGYRLKDRRMEAGLAQAPIGRCLVYVVDILSRLSCDRVNQLAGFVGRIACSIGGRGKNPSYSPDHDISIIVFRDQRVEFLHYL